MNTNLSHPWMEDPDLSKPWEPLTAAGAMKRDQTPHHLHGRIPDPPRVQMDPYFAEWRRGEETLRIRTWYAVREAPQGGHTCSALLQYYSPNNYSAGFARAGGYGYCKQSAACWHALAKILNIPQLRSYEGCGMEQLHSSLKKWGWQR